jgi:hypothetical protein
MWSEAAQTSVGEWCHHESDEVLENRRTPEEIAFSLRKLANSRANLRGEVKGPKDLEGRIDQTDRSTPIVR